MAGAARESTEGRYHQRPPRVVRSSFHSQSAPPPEPPTGKVRCGPIQSNRQSSPTTSAIAGTDDSSVEELLIVGADPATQITENLTVKVTGTVKTDFDLVTAEEEMGADLDELFADFDGEPYIDAATILMLSDSLGHLGFCRAVASRLR